MNSSKEPRATIIAWALFLILITFGAGLTLMIFMQALPAAVLLSTACLCLTLLARPGS